MVAMVEYRKPHVVRAFLKRLDFSRLRLNNFFQSYESCGLVFEDGTIIEMQNHSLNPMMHFVIDMMEARKLVESSKSDLVAVWHSHVHPSSPEPSAFDLAALPDTMFGIVLDVQTGDLRFYGKDYGNYNGGGFQILHRGNW